jgi:hypothetical protein
MELIKAITMRLVINGQKLIKDVRGEFSLAYPFLQLEFFNNEGARKTRYAAFKKISHEMALRDAGVQKNNDGFIDIKDSTTVLELESILKDDFGLSAQVFRKSGNIWLETTMTDDWTLKQQNDHGREITLSFDAENNSFNDYDLNRDI